MGNFWELKSLANLFFWWSHPLKKNQRSSRQVAVLIFEAVEDSIFHDHQQLKTRGLTLTEESPTLQDMNKFAVYCLIMPLVKWLVTITTSIIAEEEEEEGDCSPGPADSIMWANGLVSQYYEDWDIGLQSLRPVAMGKWVVIIVIHLPIWCGYKISTSLSSASVGGEVV